MSLQLDRDRIFELIGRKDYGLAGHILKQLKKCQDNHGAEFLDMLFSELSQPDEVGYYKGLNSWQRFKKLGPDVYDKFKWRVWRKAYADASRAVFEQREFTSIGEAAKKATEELIETLSASNNQAVRQA